MNITLTTTRPAVDPWAMIYSEAKRSIQTAGSTYRVGMSIIESPDRANEILASHYGAIHESGLGCKSESEALHALKQLYEHTLVTWPGHRRPRLPAVTLCFFLLGAYDWDVGRAISCRPAELRDPLDDYCANVKHRRQQWLLLFQKSRTIDVDQPTSLQCLGKPRLVQTALAKSLTAPEKARAFRQLWQALPGNRLFVAGALIQGGLLTLRKADMPQLERLFTENVEETAFGLLRLAGYVSFIQQRKFVSARYTALQSLSSIGEILPHRHLIMEAIQEVYSLSCFASSAIHP